ncbi:hypothetical protein COLO4_23734 [Corchorus olitorius]|uniref:Uncharacterized protein n=1 Tax=Corchorus olitorius TaxID=93759 RepID=A0A1R3IF16_9ROSI|nr:hypothetical protein COLO4_23734 [Corchorus olitorius]
MAIKEREAIFRDRLKTIQDQPWTGWSLRITGKQ